MADQKTDKDRKTEPASAGTQDATVAEAAGLPEGELRRLRDESGLNRLAGHQASVLEWEATPAGQEWLAGEGDRQKAIQAEQKQAEEEAEEAEKATAEFLDAVDRAKGEAEKAHKSAQRQAK